MGLFRTVQHGHGFVLGTIGLITRVASMAAPAGFVVGLAEGLSDYSSGNIVKDTLWIWDFTNGPKKINDWLFPGADRADPTRAITVGVTHLIVDIPRMFVSAGFIAGDAISIGGKNIYYHFKPTATDGTPLPAPQSLLQIPSEPTRMARNEARCVANFG